MYSKLIDWFANRTLSQRLLLAFLAGLVQVAAFAPFHVFPAFMLSWLVAYGCISTAPRARDAFLTAWLWHTGFMMLGTYWISIAFLVDAQTFAKLIPLVVFGFSSGMALYTAIMGWLFWRWRTPSLVSNIAMFAVFMVLAEYARSYVFTGFPWNLPGYAAGGIPFMDQLAAIIGVHGLGLLLGLIALSPLALLNRNTRMQALYCVVVCANIVVIYSLLSPIKSPDYLSTTIRIVQPNIAQAAKWSPEQRVKTIETLLRLSRSESAEPPDLIIWPETAYPFVTVLPEDPLKAMTANMPANTALVTGVMRGTGEGEAWRVANSLVAYDAKGMVADYDKHHLVPFGEFIPLRDYLPFQKLTKDIGDFTTGAPPMPLSLHRDGSVPPALPLICYEAIFPDLAHANTARYWLLNITNDGWFGDSIGPYQHLDMARYRAIENRVPLVRVANTGISALIDANGKVLQSLALNTEGAFEVTLPVPSESRQTLYSRWRDLPFLAACLTIVTVVLYLTSRGRKRFVLT